MKNDLNTTNEVFTPELLQKEYKAFAKTFSTRKIKEVETEIRKANLQGEEYIWVEFKNGEPDKEVIDYFTTHLLKIY